VRFEYAPTMFVVVFPGASKTLNVDVFVATIVNDNNFIGAGRMFVCVFAGITNDCESANALPQSSSAVETITTGFLNSSVNFLSILLYVNVLWFG
jgi:hypothetical protein